MPYVIATEGGNLPLSPGLPFEANGYQYAANVLDLWSQEELEAIGVLFVPLPEPEPGPPPAPVIPLSVTPAQGKMALYQAGLLDQAETMAVNHPYKPVQIYWANATTWERSNVYLNAMAQELGMTEEDVDNLFLAASIL